MALCTSVAHNIEQNRSDNFPSYPPDNHHCSDDVYLREGGATPAQLHASNCLLCCFWGFSSPTAKTLYRHSCKVCQKTQLCARMCLFWPAKPKFNIYTPFSLKTAILEPDFDSTSEIFVRLTALTLEVLPVNGR